MELKDLRLIVSVAEAHSFVRAATQMGLDRSAISRRIRAVEEALGVSLFQRLRTGVCLTDAGRQFLGDLRQVLDQLDEAVRAAAAAGTGKLGRVRIGIVASIASSFVNELLRNWLNAHPEVALDIYEGDARRHIAAIIGRALDVAFVLGAPEAPTCDVETIWTEPLFVALPRSSCLSAHHEIGWAELVSERFIVSQADPGPDFHDYIIRHLSTAGVRPSVERLAVGRDTLLALVGLGRGATLIGSAAASVSYPGVSVLPMRDAAMPFSAVWLADNDNPALRCLLSAARVQARTWSERCALLSRRPDPLP